MKSRLSFKTVIQGALLLGAAVAAPARLGAATITVNNTDDSGVGSLRQAIQTAAPGDKIDFSVTGVITLTNGALLIEQNLTIIGPGAAKLSVSGNSSSRVFEI